MKLCRWCNTEKRLSDFYKHSEMKDGHLNKCKVCCVAWTRAYRKTEKGKEVRRKEFRNPEWNRRYKKTAKGRASAKRYKRPPGRNAAKCAVRYALKMGHLKRKPCEVCRKRAEAHHWSYEKAHYLDVRWLCRKHHNQEHRELDGKRSWV